MGCHDRTIVMIVETWLSSILYASQSASNLVSEGESSIPAIGCSRSPDIGGLGKESYPGSGQLTRTDEKCDFTSDVTSNSLGST